MNISIKTESAPDGMVQWSASLQREGTPTILCQGRAWSEDVAVSDAHWHLAHQAAMTTAGDPEPSRTRGGVAGSLSAWIPGPPGQASANRARRYAVVAGRATSYQSRESKSWRKIAAAAIAAADTCGRIDARQPVEVEVCSHWPRWSRRYKAPLGDVDNPVKQVLDALVHSGVIVDDVLVSRLEARKSYDSASPGITVVVRQYQGARL